MGLILVRYAGEIGIKGRNRRFFVRRLRRNIRRALTSHDISGKVWSEGQRIYVEIDEEKQREALSVLARVFGIASISPIARVASDLDAMRAEAVALVARVGLTPTMSFRVRTRRADKSFPIPSPEVNRLVGAAIYAAVPARVDLSDEADLTVGIEIRAEGTMVYGQVIPGPGGMPIGTQGRVFVLLSGGIDSPVAAWLMMRRGCGIIPVHFEQSEVERQKALDNCRLLDRWSYGWDIKPLVLDHNALLETVLARLYELGHERWTCIFCKRAMIAKAAELAPQYRVQALVMGDSLGQVASQTIANMAAISDGAQLPILRPLIAYDKTEIMELARRIGTFDISTHDAAGCAFLPQRPITSADLDRLREIVAALE
jgi:thiamine biosynthesis protein ThiI